MRAGRWKLHLYRAGAEVEELYDLDADVGETTDLAAVHPEVVAALRCHAERARADLGDGRLGIRGEGRRRVGEVASPVTLTTFDPAHPYYMAEYDLHDRGDHHPARGRFRRTAREGGLLSGAAGYDARLRAGVLGPPRRHGLSPLSRRARPGPAGR